MPIRVADDPAQMLDTLEKSATLRPSRLADPLLPSPHIKRISRIAWLGFFMTQ